jgi:hypothetical protein
MYGAHSLQLVQRGPKKHEETTCQVSKWWVETIWIWVYFGILLPREGPDPTPACGVGYTFSTRSEDEEVGRSHGSTWRCSHRQI